MKTTCDGFDLGTCTVPCGQRGEWAIETFEISEKEAKFHNMRCMLKPGARLFQTQPGSYKRLTHRHRGVVMSNTPMEILTNRSALRQATGRILINGLGMGMLLEAVLAKSSVASVKVVEVDADVIALVGPHYARDPRVEIVHADAFAYKPARGERFDFVWHDIWDTVCADNREQMVRLVRKYRRPIASAQGVWSRDILQALAA